MHFILFLTVKRNDLIKY